MNNISGPTLSNTPNIFAGYDIHYTRMLNTPPDWKVAENDPSRFLLSGDWLPTDKNVPILDFGCGWGHQLMALWCSGYRNITGVELNPEQAKHAKEASEGKCTVVCTDGRDFLKEKKNTYSVILMYDVIEHFTPQDGLETLKLIYDSLIPGGIFVVRTPNMSNILSAYSRYIDITHLFGYTEYSLMQLLDIAGFSDHTIVRKKPKVNLRQWRPWAPWRGLNLRYHLNQFSQKVFFKLRSQYPLPTVFDYNLELFTYKIHK